MARFSCFSPSSLQPAAAAANSLPKFVSHFILSPIVSCNFNPSLDLNQNRSQSAILLSSTKSAFTLPPATNSNFISAHQFQHPAVSTSSGHAQQCRSQQGSRPLSTIDGFSFGDDQKREMRCAYQQQLGALVISGPGDEYPHNYVSFTEAIVEMSRLQNYIPSMSLVFLGSWMAGGRTISVFLRSSVWITAVCSALITVASMLANDIFDYRSGTDRLNGKSTPLLRGQVHPDHVELVAGCLYSAAMIGVCFLEPQNLRLLVGGAAVATYIYTPFLKKLTIVKNLVVSGIISSSILAGGMVISGTQQMGNPIICVATFFFLCILSREILMDVEDMVGDKAAGVKTLAVRFGGRVGTLTASICLAAANALLINLLAVKARAYATIGTLSLLPLHAMILQLLRGSVWADINASAEAVKKSVDRIVKQSMVHIGLGVMLLAAVM